MREWEQFRKASNSQFSQGEVRKVLHATLAEMAPWQIYTRARVPFIVANAIFRLLQAGEWLHMDIERMWLTTRGDALARELGVAKGDSFTCPTCQGSGVDGLQKQAAFLRFVELFEERPRGEQAAFDQSSVTPLSTARRLSWMIHNGDVAGKRVAVLGDDDYLGIALGLTRLPAEVTVMEIDPRLCEYMQRISEREGLGVQVILQDLAKPLPSALLGHFDTFATDPPDADLGMRLFLDKGLALLQPGDGNAGYFGVTTIEAAMDKWARWQKYLVNAHALVIASLLPPFAEYMNWADQQPVGGDLAAFSRVPAANWYRSWYYRIETLKSFIPPRDYETTFSPEYIDDVDGYDAEWNPVAAR